MRRMLSVATVLVLLAACTAAVAQRPIEVQHRYAVLVGVAHYEDRGIARDLHGPRNDVTALADVLFRKYKFKPDVLLDGQATKSAVWSKLRAARDKAEPGDQVIFYFSGYGSVDNQGKPSLCPYDAEADSAANDLLAGDLWAWVNEVGRKKATPVVILDSCFFEAARAMGARKRAKYLERTDEVSDADVAKVGKVLGNVASAGGRGVLMVASGPGEPAREWDRGGDDWAGVFTLFLIDELATLDDAISFRQLTDRIVPKVRRFVQDQFHSDTYMQTPAIYPDAPYVASVGMFSSGDYTVETRSAGNHVRLQVVSYGDEGETERAIRQALASMRHVQLVPTAESADLSLFLFKVGDELRPYMVDYGGKTVEDDFPDPVTAYDEFLGRVNRRVGGIVAYRWSASLPNGDAGLNVKLRLTNAAGEDVSSVSVNEKVFVNMETAQDCYVTLFAIAPNGEYKQMVPKLTSGGPDSRLIGAGTPWRQDFHSERSARYRLLAVAKRRQDVPSDQLLRSLWDASAGAVAMGGESIALPPFVSQVSMGETLAEEQFSTAVVDLAFVESE